MRWLSHFGSQHVLLFAPTGAGKGVGVILPTLVTYPSSVFVYDLKKENWDKTAGYRQRVFKNVVIRFEPSDSSGTSARFNPLDTIRIGTVNEMKDAQKLAFILIDTEGKGLHDHWTKSAYDLVTGAILHICYTKRERNLGGLALFLDGIDPDTNNAYKNEIEWLSEMSGRPFADTSVNGMQKKTFDNIHALGFSKYKGIPIAEAIKTLKAANLIDDNGINIRIKAASSKLIEKGEKAAGERSSIISSASAVLSLYKDPIIAMNTATSDFKLEDLQSFKQAVSLYLCIPNDDRDRLNPLVRIIVTLTISTIQSSLHGKLRELLFILDEFAEMKKIQEMTSALATIRGYQARMLIVIQDYAQLETYYDKLAKSVFSNCGVRVAYPANETSTQEMLSKMSGVMTYVKKTKNISYSDPGLFKSKNSSVSISPTETQRQLLTSDEVSRLGDKMIVFIEKQDPILCKQFRWFEDDQMKSRIYDQDHPINNYKAPNSSDRIVRKVKKVA